MVDKIVSPKWSFKGFKISQNLGNGIKNAAYALIGAIIGEFVIGGYVSEASGAIISTCVCKTVEYFVSEYTK